MKKLIQILLCCMFLFSLTAVAEETAAIEKIEIIAEKTEFEPQEEYTFKIKAYPETTEELKVKWSVDKYFIAPVVPDAGFMVAVFPGEAVITAQLVDYPEITASVNIKVLGDNTEAFEAKEISMMIQDNLYIGNYAAEYEMSIKLLSEVGGVIPENLEGVGWSQYYYLEYTDNLEGKKGISRDGNVIYIAEDAEPAEDLYVAVTVKRKADDAVIISAESNKFNVVKKIDVTGIKVDGNAAEKADDGKYYCTAAKAEEITVEAEADRQAYYAYQINGGIIKRAADGKIDTAGLSEGKNTVTVYVFGDNRKGAVGYTMAALAETVVITVN